MLSHDDVSLSHTPLYLWIIQGTKIMLMGTADEVAVPTTSKNDVKFIEDLPPEEQDRVNIYSFFLFYQHDVTCETSYSCR